MLRTASARYVLATFIGCVLVSNAQADIFEEVHTYSQATTELDWDSSVTLPLDIQKFDTYGGTRELLGMTIEYSVHNTYTVTIHDNPTADDVGCEVMWWEGWSGTLADGVILPVHPGMGGSVGSGSGFGVYRVPFQPGEVLPPQGGGSGWIDSGVADPAYLDLLTGTGALTIDSTFWIGAIECFPCVFYPGPEPPVFDPDIMDISFDELALDMTITYAYTPEPASAGFLALAGVLCLIRRKRS